MPALEVFKDFLQNYKSVNELEEIERHSFIHFINACAEKAYIRENLLGHITVSCWIINEKRDKVLMAHHNLYHSWGWIGGHADGETDLLKVAHKETMEETGVTKLKLVTPALIDLNVLPVFSHIKKGKQVPSHLHYNVVYAFVADETDHLRIKEDENSAVAWIEKEKVLEYCSEPHMIPYYERIMQKIEKIS